MKKKHAFFYLIIFTLKKIFSNIINWFKNFKYNFLKKRNRIKHLFNYFFSKDGFSFYLNKMKFNLNYLRYRFIHLIKSIINNSKKLLDSGYLSFTIFLYILLSLLFFLLAYNLWIQSYDTVKIPDFKGIKVLEAIDQIQSLKLIPVIESRFSNLPYGSIISQYPYAGHVIKQNRKVRLVVSKGLEYSFLEDFSGWALFTVEKRALELSNILKREIKVEKISEEFSDIFEKGYIISQQPEAGTELSLLESIKVVISKGKIPEEFIMPDLIGKSIEEAQKIVDQLGLILDIQYQQVEDLNNVGIVLSQTPNPKDKVSKGITVTITVGQKNL